MPNILCPNMDEINRLYNEINDFGALYDSYINKRDECKFLEEEIDRITKEMKAIDIMSLQKEIADMEQKYQNIFKAVDKYNLENSECHDLKGIRVLYENIDDPDILRHKTVNYLETLVYPYYLRYEVIGEIVDVKNYFGDAKASWTFTLLKVSKEANDLLLFLVDYPEISDICKAELYNILKKELQSKTPNDIRLFTTQDSLYMLYKSNTKKESDYFTKRDMEYLELIGLIDLKGVGETIYKLMRDNLSEALISRQLTPEEIRENNNSLSKSIHFITNIDEWRLDIIMKKMIYLSKERVTELELFCVTREVGESDQIRYIKKAAGHQNSGLMCSESYYRFIVCMDIFRGLKSDRVEKASKLLEKITLKYFDPRRVAKSPRNYIILFSEISHYIKNNTSYSYLPRLIRTKEDLFFYVIKESASIQIDIYEEPTKIKAYLKQKHYDFDENVLQVIPENNRPLFEIQFFEALYRNLIKFVQSFDALSLDQINTIKMIFEYTNGLSFSISKDTIPNCKQFQSYLLILNSSISDVIRLYNDRALNVKDEEIESLVLTIFKKSSIRDNFVASLK